MGNAMRHACGFFETNRMLMCLPPCHPATLLEMGKVIRPFGQS